MADLAGTARVRHLDIQEITESQLDEPIVNAFINTANQLVENLLVGQGLGEETLTEIEKYLTAHFMTLLEPKAHSEQIDTEYRVTYQGQTKMRLEASFYGQTALLLDSSGSLQRASEELKSVRFVVHGDDE